MPKLTCLCGEIINLSLIPNDTGFLIFGERQYEDLVDAAARQYKDPVLGSEPDRRLYDYFEARRPKPELIECPKCGRLALFRNMSDDVPIWYVPVSPIKGGSLRRLFVSEETEAEKEK